MKRPLSIPAVLVACGVAASLTPASAAPVCVPVPVLADRCETWLRASDPALYETGGVVASSSDGSTLYTAGIRYDETFLGSWVVTAVNASDGSAKWSKVWNGESAAKHDFPYSVAASDGQVFVSGIVDTDWSGGLFGVVAFDATDGTVIWTRYHTGILNGMTYARRLAISPDGATVVATGTGHDPDFSDASYETTAIDAATGTLRWSRSYHPGPGATWGVAISPDSSTTYVTGIAGTGIGTNYVFGTVAYDMSTGDQRWTSSYDGGFNIDGAETIALSPDGSRVYVGGWSQTAATGGRLHPYTAFTVVALDAVDGSRVWVAKQEGVHKGQSVARGLAVTNDGATVLATGEVLSAVPEQSWDLNTTAFRASDGGVIWTERYDLPGKLLEQTSASALSPDSSRFYVTAISRTTGGTSVGQDPSDAVTIAYDVATGTHAWVARLNALIAVDSTTSGGLAATAGGVYVAGTSSGNDGHLQSLMASYAP